MEFFATDPTAKTLVGLRAKPPDACRCREHVATVGGSGGSHIGELICSGCGAHRGWLSHETASFISKNIEQFGRPTEPIDFRRGQSRKGTDDMKSKFEIKPMTGSLFVNDKKKSENGPDYTGSMNVEGVEYRLSGWKKTAKTGTKFLSLSVQAKVEARTAKTSAPNFEDDFGI